MVGSQVVSLLVISNVDKSTTGDAIIAALQVLTVMVEQAKALHELVADFELFPQVLINVRLQHMIDPYAQSLPLLLNLKKLNNN